MLTEPFGGCSISDRFCTKRPHCLRTFVISIVPIPHLVRQAFRVRTHTRWLFGPDIVSLAGVRVAGASLFCKREDRTNHARYVFDRWERLNGIFFFFYVLFRRNNAKLVFAMITRNHTLQPDTDRYCWLEPTQWGRFCAVLPRPTSAPRLNTPKGPGRTRAGRTPRSGGLSATTAAHHRTATFDPKTVHT